ncbi:glycosyltransferase family 2 protein [Limnofasciculus baicalensis]|uniref:Glycosyltransferase family 2 protein n=1 Tax=Limnofasciculus baicalensis BBK-W-15 TaxID=2699891 RepID=A0AAE3GP04_9CYAN|nr:glycosyltransferase family A protein [Limnofasciculus baicalensis]MCP2727283.1 glycosyltransferase family 2 protein [Limnofasciculus baicalensis BBK-W-15]
MNKNSSSVSVIIPVYNGERYLSDAIESVLFQSYEPLEIIVVDDGSTDKTAQIKRRFGDKICYLYQDNSGPSRARNTGIKIAKGEIITFLDADDLWSQNKLQLQVGYLGENPSLEVVIGSTQFMELTLGDEGQKFVEIGEPRIFLNLGSAIFRKSVFDRVGLFDTTLRYSEDVDWFNRARESTISILKHQELVLIYRQHEQNMTKNKVANELNILKVLKLSLDRRRSKNDGVAMELTKLSEELE